MGKPYLFRCGTFRNIDTFSGEAPVFIDVDDTADPADMSWHLEETLFHVVADRVRWLSGDELDRAVTDPREHGVTRLGIHVTSKGCDLVATLSRVRFVEKPDGRQLSFGFDDDV